MFGRHHEGKKRVNPILALFRLLLSLIIFFCLLIGIYFAYKQFSGYDPLKLDLKNIANSLLRNPEAQKTIDKIASILKIPSPSKTLGINTQGVVPAGNPAQDNGVATSKEDANGKAIFSFLLVADSHNDNINLAKALQQAKSDYSPVFAIGLGDYTQVGTLDELSKAKKEFDLAGIRYFLIPGDHDLWDSRDKKKDATANFIKTFGPSYQSFSFKNYKFILINNADNYLGLGGDQIKWITSQLDSAKEEGVKGIFVMLHEPLYHPSSERTMGKSDNQFKNEAASLIYQFKQAGVMSVFAGDIHFFTQYQDPGTNLNMVTVGALTSERNTQASRFAIIEVLSDGSFKVNDVEIK